MNILILIFCFVATALALPVSKNSLSNLTYILYEVSPGVYVKEDLTIKSNYHADVSDVKIYFYSRNKNDGVEVDLTDINSLQSTDFSNTKPTVFCVHGWRNDFDSDVNSYVRTAYLQAEDANVFIVDWSKIAQELYVIAQANVESVGNIVGELINNLVRGAGLNLGNTVLVGHSLGAHIAGVAGKHVGGGADYVVGLDPAGPLFSMDNKDNRITTESGRFVEIIHTNAGLLGMIDELGHVDFWPNGGKTQPGCLIDITGACAHGRSYEYFSESIVSGNFIARQCQDWDTYQNGQCSNNPSAFLGQVPIDRSASGNYFLETNSQPPYAEG